MKFRVSSDHGKATWICGTEKKEKKERGSVQIYNSSRHARQLTRPQELTEKQRIPVDFSVSQSLHLDEDLHARATDEADLTRKPKVLDDKRAEEVETISSCGREVKGCEARGFGCRGRRESVLVCININKGEDGT